MGRASTSNRARALRQRFAATWASLAFVAALLISGCGSDPAEPAPLSPGQFAFAVFGDGPYRSWERGRYKRLIEDVNGADLSFFVHVGDILWYPCSDDEYRDRLDSMNRIRHPVVYTPGDNEWADCHESIPGGYVPRERLARIREMFFADPRRALGGETMTLVTQADDPEFGEFVENARWRYGGFVFVTVHVVGDENAYALFDGRAPADDAAAARLTDAAVAWLADGFAEAESASGIVILSHASPNLERNPEYGEGAPDFVNALEDLTKAYAGTVLFVHGDWHEFTVDQPLRDRRTGETITNFTRLETFGSPDIGWVRVVLDSTAGEVVKYEPRMMSRRFFFW